METYNDNSGPLEGDKDHNVSRLLTFMAMDTSLEPTSASNSKNRHSLDRKRTYLILRQVEFRAVGYVTTDEISNESVLEGGRHLQEFRFKHSVYGGQHVLLLGPHFVHASLSCSTRFYHELLQKIPHSSDPDSVVLCTFFLKLLDE